ncbi:MAG: tRNA (guanosine(37)-N1)-methyltransferase TrmD [Clostridiales bacterium]|jgi:tRNA (guanine37-N1)-methyltransferase|nr:tRNA (guanosine(37)-N1)-methyltransferase TrmD [Clostridiales bacterium]
MMKFHVLTLFPEVFESLNHSMIKRGIEAGHIAINPVNIRDFAQNNRRQTDGYPYGGGAGMIISPEPIYLAYKSLDLSHSRLVYLTPTGRVFNQDMAAELAQEADLILLCGHYEGVDQRIIDEIVTDEISLGDFVLTGGEIAAIAVIDAVARLVPGVLKPESLAQESFSQGILEYPQYTRPPEFLGRKVPEVLLSGHHGEIEKWRREQALEATRRKRPDLLR